MRLEAANRAAKKAVLFSFCDCGEPIACHETAHVKGVACELGDSARGSTLTSGLALVIKWTPEPLRMFLAASGASESLHLILIPLLEGGCPLPSWRGSVRPQPQGFRWPEPRPQSIAGN